MNIIENLNRIKSELPAGIRLVAVSKFQPATSILEAYEAGQIYFGESRVQELLDKIEVLPREIKWHFIGHLQTNKVRPIVGKVEMIESIDSEKLLNLIDLESKKSGVVSRVLLQVHVAAETTKFGFLPDELLEYFRNKKYETLTSTHICGLMGMATNTYDELRIRKDFAEISGLYRKIKEEISPELTGFDEISMGMSHDWPLAVEEGATIVRIGSDIFGERE